MDEYAECYGIYRLLCWTRYPDGVKFQLSLLIPSLGLLCFGPTAQAVTLRMTADALERTLQQKLFLEPEHRYYLRGLGKAGCPVFADNPTVSFRDERVVVHVHLHARIGKSVGGFCLGIGLSTEADVTFLPATDGEKLGFQDARIENLDLPGELVSLVSPFLSRKLPQQMEFRAADLLQKALSNSRQRTGYELQLQQLQIRSLQVEQNALVLVVDGELDVR